jgi:hypothetical protein
VQGHDERPVPLLRQAYEIARSARTAGQLGLAEMALGYWISAAGHLDEALAEESSLWVEKNARRWTKRCTLPNRIWRRFASKASQTAPRSS